MAPVETQSTRQVSINQNDGQVHSPPTQLQQITGFGPLHPPPTTHHPQNFQTQTIVTSTQQGNSPPLANAANHQLPSNPLRFGQSSSTLHTTYVVLNRHSALTTNTHHLSHLAPLSMVMSRFHSLAQPTPRFPTRNIPSTKIKILGSWTGQRSWSSFTA